MSVVTATNLLEGGKLTEATPDVDFVNIRATVAVLLGMALENLHIIQIVKLPR